jgi:hypothetical protein
VVTDKSKSENMKKILKDFYCWIGRRFCWGFDPEFPVSSLKAILGFWTGWRK